ncbi:MAG: GNAT family N-acetyltransferase [bacterium]|nr:GNAT family N-acetyltransferase [bacterium]
MTSWTIRLASHEDAAAWDAFADVAASVPVMARFAWGRAITATYGVPILRLLAADARGRIVGICPVCIAKNGCAYSLRYGLAAQDDTVAAALLNAVRAECVARGVTAALVTSGTRTYAVPYPTRAKETVVIPIVATEEETWTSLRNKTRNMIRRAQREGCTVREDRDACDAFYVLLARRMLAKGVPVHARRFFATLLRELGDAGALLIAEQDGRMVGGMLLCLGPRCAVYPYQATARGAERSAATQLLIWEAMRRCVARGIPLLDMGESSVGSSVHASKLHFGGKSHTIAYYDVLEGAPSRTLDGRVRAAVLRAAAVGMRVLPTPLGVRLGSFVKRAGRLV